MLPKGTQVEVIAHFDNSANNKFNPDPSKDVRWGDQTWEEMMIGFFSTIAEPAGRPNRAASALIDDVQRSNPLNSLRSLKDLCGHQRVPR